MNNALWNALLIGIFIGVIIGGLAVMWIMFPGKDKKDSKVKSIWDSKKQLPKVKKFF